MSNNDNDIVEYPDEDIVEYPDEDIIEEFPIEESIFKSKKPLFSSTASIGEMTTISPASVASSMLPFQAGNIMSEIIKGKSKELLSPYTTPLLQKLSPEPLVSKSRLLFPKTISDIGFRAGTQATPKQIGETTLDYALDPRTYLPLGGTKAGQKLLLGTERMLIKPADLALKAGRGIKGIFTAGKQLKEVEKKIAEIPIQQNTIRQSMFDIKKVAKGKLSEMANVFEKTNNQLSLGLKNEAILQSETNKSLLRDLFKNISNTYKAGIEKAENSLIRRGINLTPKDYIDNVVDRTINDLRMRAIPEDNPAFKEIVNLKNFIETQYPSNQLTLQYVKSLKNSIVSKISSAVKSGTAYADIDDFASNIFLKNHADYLGKLSPELATLNKQFAPMAQSRTWAMKTFKPYNEMEIQRGANVLERIAKSEVPNQTDINYLKQLENGSGQFKGIGKGQLVGQLMPRGKELRLTKQSFDIAKKNLVDATDYRITQLQDEIAMLQSKGIALGQRVDRLKQLIRTRNILIGVGLGIAGASRYGRPATQLILRD